MTGGGLGQLLLAFLQLVDLHLRRLAVKDKGGLEALLQQADCAVEHARQVTGDLPGLVGQVHPRAPQSNLRREGREGEGEACERTVREEEERREKREEREKEKERGREKERDRERERG